jgi:hypothetical protein
MTVPSERELDDAVVKRLLDQIAEKDEHIKVLLRWIVVLIGICLALLVLGASDRFTGPEWSGASHVDGRG